MFLTTGTLVEDRTTPIAAPSEEEKRRLGEHAPQYGVTLHLAPH